MTVLLFLITATSVIIQTASRQINDASNLTLEKNLTLEQLFDASNTFGFNISSQDGLTQEEINRLARFVDLISVDPLSDDIILPEDNLEGIMVEDMLVSYEDYKQHFNSSKDHSRKLINMRGAPERKWPDGVDGWPEIPYTTENLPKVLQIKVKDAVNHWHKHTCVRFKPVQNMKRPYVKIQLYRGCGSRVGRQKMVGQMLGLATSCSLGSVIHELGHTLGFFHEHQRYDRLENIYLHAHNVMDKCGGRLRGCDPNFKEKTRSDMYSHDTPYDLGSIMHYGQKMFTSSKGHFTLGALDAELTGVTGQRSRLSHRDIHLINLAYNCINKWVELCGFKIDSCINEGYIGPDCKCVCPPGTAGAICHIQTGTYYDNVRPPCNQHITSPATISATHEDIHQLPDDVDKPAAWCVFTIEAPSCHVPEITITRFHIPDMFWRTKVRCKYAWVEFKEHSELSGQMFCGTELKSGKKIVGTSHKMSVFFYVGSGLRGYFSASVTFKRDDYCDVMADEALIASPFGKPLTTGNCNFEMGPEGYIWSSSRKINDSVICSVIFNKEPAPFGLILKLAETTSSSIVSNTSSDLVCHRYIHYCLHEERCAKLDLNTLKDNQLMLPSSRLVFEYSPNDPRCGFELQMNPRQSNCHKIMLVDNENQHEELIIDEPPGACQIWCKTLLNRQVRVQIHIFRIIQCDSEDEWIEISGGLGDTERKHICVRSNTDKLNATNSIGYWYSFDSEDNKSYITMQYKSAPKTPLIVTCMLKGWNSKHDPISENKEKLN